MEKKSRRILRHFQHSTIPTQLSLRILRHFVWCSKVQINPEVSHLIMLTSTKTYSTYSFMPVFDILNAHTCETQKMARTMPGWKRLMPWPLLSVGFPNGNNGGETTNDFERPDPQQLRTTGCPSILKFLAHNQSTKPLASTAGASATASIDCTKFPRTARKTFHHSPRTKEATSM